MGKIYQVQVYGISGEMKMIDLCSSEEEMRRMTVRQLRKKVEERFSEIAGKKDTFETAEVESALLIPQSCSTFI